MPAKRKGCNLSRQTIKSRLMRQRRAQRSDEEIQKDNLNVRVRIAKLRESESQEVRNERNQQKRLERKEKCRFLVKKGRAIVQQRQQVLGEGEEADTNSGIIADVKIETEGEAYMEITPSGDYKVLQPPSPCLAWEAAALATVTVKRETSVDAKQNESTATKGSALATTQVKPMENSRPLKMLPSNIMICPVPLAGTSQETTATAIATTKIASSLHSRISSFIRTSQSQAIPSNQNINVGDDNTNNDDIEPPSAKKLRPDANEKYRAFGEFVVSSLSDLPPRKALLLVEKLTSEVVQTLIQCHDDDDEENNKATVDLVNGVTNHGPDLGASL